VTMVGSVFIVVSPLHEQPRWPHAEVTGRRSNKFRSMPDFFVMAAVREKTFARLSLVSRHAHAWRRQMTERDDGMNRRKILECMTWAGTGALWTITGGVP